MRTRLLCWLTIVWLFHLQAQYTEHIVIVVIDGARYTETFGDSTHANIPQIWDQLRPLGTIYTAFSNDSLTLTVPGHSNIVTGTWQNIPNDGTEWPDQPTIFEYYRKQKSAGPEECWVSLGKSKLEVLSYSTHADFGPVYAASVRSSASPNSDSIAWENTRYVLTNYRPKLTVVNLPETDVEGHSGVWDNYISALRRADTVVASLWSVIQADSSLQNKTTMIVTNDHGRHTSDFTSHGDGCEGCRHIMLLIIGSDTPAGSVDSLPHSQVDIAPTAGEMLGFTTTYSTGTVLQSAIITTVSADIADLPKFHILNQNYPNPFNPTTTIEFQIPPSPFYKKGERGGFVSLKIYDLLGREVATLVSEKLPAGRYTRRWNAEGMASGMYFYRLRAGDFVSTRKMLLLK